MKQLFIIGLFAFFSIFFACSFQSDASAPDALRTVVSPTPQAGENAGKSPVLVELFTSEGCSSCPPAERVLAQLEREQPNPNAEIITLALHVDYWNRLGWKDEFSSPLYSQRQSVYGRRLNLDGVYTPQMIVDGQKQFVGSNLPEANKAISESAKSQKAKIELAAAESFLKIKITDIPKHETASVFLAIAEDDIKTSVKAGENSGRRLEHASVVRELRSIGVVPNGQNDYSIEASVQLQSGWKKDKLKFVVFVQENASRKILGVNRISAL